MTVFIDTSSLVKRYILEEGSATFSEIIRKVTAIIVAPVTVIEIYSALDRRLRDKSLSPDDYRILEEEILRNFNDFSIVHWNNDLIISSLDTIRQHHLRTLDAIQLAAAIISGVSQMITSDKQLYQAAKKEIKKAILLEK